MKNKYLNKKVLIIGLGATGISCLNFFLKQGVIPMIMDTRKEIPKIYSSIFKNIKIHLGSLNKNWLKIADLIILSPGISIFHPLIAEAKKLGSEVIGDIDLFCREINSSIIAITGSNGKSSVTSLLSNIANKYEISNSVGGNIGIPVLNLLNQKRKSLYIIEISSFQLESVYKLKTLASTILNISDDHLDRYPLGLSQYIDCKLNIYNHAEICLCNADDKFTYPKKKQYCEKKTLSFGQSNHANYHLFLDKKNFYLQKKNSNILNTKKMKLKGIHNYMNALAALCLSDILNIPTKIAIKEIINFAGLPHRFQIVYKNKGVTWINDSKSTNVGSTIQALNSIKTNGTIWLLLGGITKQLNFKNLIPYLKNNIKIYCFGQDKNILFNLRPKQSIKKKDLKSSIKDIRKKIKSNDIVILSPACSSYDQFKNFEDRGNYFTYLAKKFG